MFFTLLLSIYEAILTELLQLSFLFIRSSVLPYSLEYLATTFLNIFFSISKTVSLKASFLAFYTHLPTPSTFELPLNFLLNTLSVSSLSFWLSISQALSSSSSLDPVFLPLTLSLSTLVPCVPLLFFFLSVFLYGFFFINYHSLLLAHSFALSISLSLSLYIYIYIYIYICVCVCVCVCVCSSPSNYFGLFQC